MTQAVILTMVADREQGLKIARSLVEAGLAGRCLSTAGREKSAKNGSFCWSLKPKRPTLRKLRNGY
mgnify:CR=1 FL=1